MELSQEEKDRIVAEEKLRFETKRQLMQEQSGSRCGGWGGWGQPGYGWGHRRGFWRGLFLGLLLAVLFSFLCHHHRYGGFCGQGGACFYGTQNAEHPAPPPQALPK